MSQSILYHAYAGEHHTVDTVEVESITIGEINKARAEIKERLRDELGEVIVVVVFPDLHLKQRKGMVRV